jgi:hypothetical protein
MIYPFLLIFLFLATPTEARDFSEVVEQYVQINQEKIKTITAHRERIKGVEIIIADKAENFASRFGHGLIRLIDNDATWVNDAVISFSALSYDEKYSLRKSIFGGYSVLPEAMTLYEFWNRYTEKEDRDLKRYVINLSEEDLERFLDLFFRYVNDPAQLDSYTFFSNNCIGVISKIFVESGLTKSKDLAKIPTAVGSWIEKNELSQYPEFIMENQAALKRRVSHLDLNKLSHDELVEAFSAKELNYIYFNNNRLSEEKIDFLASYLKEQGQEMNSVFGFTPIHHSLYARPELEQAYLKPSDMVRTIIHRIEKDMTSNLSHLNFSQKTLMEVSLRSYNLQSHSLTEKKNELVLTVVLQSNFHENRRTVRRMRMPKFKLLENQGLALLKNENKVELKLIEL